MAEMQKVLSDDDYWGASNASSSTKNIFDENVDLDTAKRILRNQKLDDEPEFDEDVINWDGTPAREEPKSARFRPPSAQNNRSFSTQLNAAPSGTRSSAKGDSSYTSYSSNSQTIDDIVSSEKQRPLSMTDVSKLQAENKVLRRNLEAAKEEKILTPREAIVNMITGQRFTLEKFKSREDKVKLLDEAISTGDGDSIITTLLFVRDSIKQSIFNLELMRRPVAIEHYILFLKQQTETDFFNQLIDLLGMLGRTEEAAMLKYKQAAKPLSHDSKIKALQNCLRSHFQTDPSLSFESTLISDQISLIESQLPVDASDAISAQKRMYSFKDGYRMPLLDTPVISTLLYSCVYHYEDKESYLGSPIAVRNKHGLTDKQYLWTAIKARGKLKRWDEIAKLFETKGWLGGTKMKSVVGFDRVISLLKDLGAPRSELNKYCNLIEGADRRLEIGLKYGCCESVIETYKYMRDRQKLLTYESTLPPNSPEQFHATGILKDQTIKWKN